jgi:cyclopropane fatty-acyl-phospholipid synthase-like methyltransferase
MRALAVLGVANLITNAEKCRRLVDEVTYRTWLLYLAASAVNFEDGRIDCVEVVLRGSSSRM